MQVSIPAHASRWAAEVSPRMHRVGLGLAAAMTLMALASPAPGETRDLAWDRAVIPGGSDGAGLPSRPGRFPAQDPVSGGSQDSTPIEVPRERPAGPLDPLRQARERGLEWLAKDVLAGSRVSLGSSEYRSPVGVTALVALAFMAGGNTTNRGPHQRALTVTIDYLLDHAGDEDSPHPGYISAVEDLRSQNHGHGLAVLALTQAYSLSPGSPRGRRMAAAIQAGVACIEQSQSPAGGWHYEPVPMDLHEGSVTVCLLQALRGARNIGFQVDRKVIDRAVEYVRSLQDEQGGFVYSLQQPNSSVALTGACLSTLHATGVYSGDEIEEGYLYVWRKLALREQDQAMGRHTADSRFPFYERLYLAQALWQHPEEKVFRTWAEQESRVVLKTQEPDGSWRDRRFDAGGRQVDSRYGRAYATAMNVLYLAVPEGTLPFFQR